MPIRRPRSIVTLATIKQDAKFRPVPRAKNCDLCVHYNGNQLECQRLKAYKFTVNNPEIRVCDHFTK